MLDTHTHADHFSAAKELGRILNARVVTHRLSPAPYADFRLCDGEILRVGQMRLTALHTPGHTRDSMCMVAEDRVFTGDTLLIGGTGRTDLPTGDPDALYDSLFNRVLKLDPALKVYPAHDYKGRSHSTIGGRDRCKSAPAEARARCLCGDDARTQSGSAHPSDRSAAHQYERRQDRGADCCPTPPPMSLSSPWPNWPNA